MNPTIFINERVDVVAIFKKSGDIQMLCYPYKMKYKDREIEFTELALRHATSQGKRQIHVFDMSDGVNDYRLEFDTQSLTWTLVAVVEGHYENTN